MSDALRIALVGNPNCGKTSLFNHLTGTRQKVANYAGVTVERKVGHFQLPSGTVQFECSICRVHTVLMRPVRMKQLLVMSV